MPRAVPSSLTFERGPLVPVVAYLVVVAVLSGLLFVSSTASPPPILGMAWGGLLAALAVGALAVEGVSPRTLFPSLRSLVSALAVLSAFWGLYNLAAVGLALGGVAAWSGVAAHPLPYLAALASSFLFTAVPEELFFRGYLQEKCVALAGGDARRAIVVGVAVTAVLFALFHLPRWALASGHGVSAALGVRLAGLTAMGLAYGLVYAMTANLWLVALLHATMNYPPLVVTVPSERHLLVGVVEYAAVVTVVAVALWVLGPDRTALVRPR